MTELFVSAFVTFLVVIDPPGCAPIFASLTRGGDAAHRRRMAIRSAIVAETVRLDAAVPDRPVVLRAWTAAAISARLVHPDH